MESYAEREEKNRLSSSVIDALLRMRIFYPLYMPGRHPLHPLVHLRMDGFGKGIGWSIIAESTKVEKRKLALYLG